MMKSLTLLRVIAVLTLFFVPLSASAFDYEQKDDVFSARLLTKFSGVGNESIIPIGLEIKLAPGWHTYWRSPGQAGLPPQFDWSQSQNDEGNLQSATVFYPTPHRFSYSGLETMGYENGVLFPIDAKVQTPGKALNLKLNASFVLCSSICIPKQVDLQLHLPEGPAISTAQAALLREARGLLPQTSDKTGITLRNVRRQGKEILFTFSSLKPFSHPDLLIENDGNIEFTAPKITTDSTGLTTTFGVELADALSEKGSLERQPLTLTLTDGTTATEIEHVSVPLLLEKHAWAPASFPLGKALLFAFIGGFLLNLMPCVLPVLSLKLIGILQHNGKARRSIRQSFLATAAGIVFSLLVLAAAMIFLKAMGLAIGWGIQFQQPLFLGFLILVLVFFASNLWGFFDINLPHKWADKLTSMSNTKLAEDFGTGALTALLTTPCSAPFLGTAVGFALAAGVKEILAIFFSLGLGLALPYFMIALFPQAVGFLPKPGPWMVRLRQILGLALIGTALWLVYVLETQIGIRNAAIFSLVTAALTAFLALRKTAAAALALFGTLALFFNSGFAPEKPPLTEQGPWKIFTPALLASAQAEGKTVFLDVTADWCLTCKANETLVFSNVEVQRKLFSPEIVALRADWTIPDPEIAAVLRTHKRYGVPFNLVLGPTMPEGIVLPELLTPAIVLETLDKAAQRSSNGF